MFPCGDKETIGSIHLGMVTPSIEEEGEVEEEVEEEERSWETDPPREIQPEGLGEA